jgi:hypothetical protein
MSSNRVVPWVRVHRRPAQPLVVERKDGKVCSRSSFYVLVPVAVVVGVDVLFFRNRFWQRLMVNVGIVLVFVSFYLRFLKRP